MSSSLEPRLLGRNPSAWIVALGLVVWGATLWPLHDALPMWVEGMPAYMDQLVAMIREPCTPPVNTVSLGRLTVPLAIDAYQGPLNTYLDIPIARKWLEGGATDLYAYRYKGIVLLGIGGMLLFTLLRRIAPPAIAVLATFTFATLPINAVTAISDLQYHIALYIGVLGILIAAVRYAESGKPACLLAMAALAGFALWTRAEALIWTAAAGFVYGWVSGRTAIANRWRTTSRRGALAIGCLVAFLIGGAPIVLFNAMYPQSGLIGFLLEGGAAKAASDHLGETLAVRFRQFASFNLLNRWGLYELSADHWAFAFGFVACAVVVVLTWLRTRKVTFPLLAIAVVLLLSVLAHRGPREIHLLPLTLAVVAVMAEGAARLRRPAGASLMAVVLMANLAVNAKALQNWEAMRGKGDTLVTHSCPACLARRLEPYATSASFYFTNIGLYHEALWASRARICGVDILNWGDEPGFRNAIRAALERTGSKVFVAFPAERERKISGRALPRTDALQDELRLSGASYRTELVPDASGRELYELFVVTSRKSPGVQVSGGGLNPPAAGVVTGWVTGTGFQPSDRVAIDGHPLPTTFGSPEWITFVVGEAEVTDRRALAVQLLRGRDLYPAVPILLQRP